MEVDRARVLAFRLAGQGLDAPGPDPAAALGRWAVQDSPPGAAAAALAARTEPVAPGWLDAALADRTAVALYNARTATAVVLAADAAAYGTAQLPADDAGLKAIAGSAVPGRTEGFSEPVELAVEAIADSLDGRVLSRDDLHEELRRRLPAELLPWCPGCKSHHARRGLLVMASLRGRLCIAGRAGRQPAFARTDQWIGWEAPDRPTPAPAWSAGTCRPTGRPRRLTWRGGPASRRRMPASCGRRWRQSWPRSGSTARRAPGCWPPTCRGWPTRRLPRACG